MDNTLTFRAGEPTSPPDRRATDARNQMAEEMINHSAPGTSLPCRADRQKIIEQVNRVLAKARFVAEQSDRTLALLE
jgi:hypothetical protein